MDRTASADHPHRARSRPTSSSGASARRAVPAASTRTRRTPRSSCCFDIEASPSLGPRQRARLLETARPAACASSRRSAARSMQNRELALERLRERLAAALHIDPPRSRDPAVAVREAGARRAEAPRRRTQADPARAARRRVLGRRCTSSSTSLLIVVGVVAVVRRARRRAAHVRAPARRAGAVHAASIFRVGARERLRRLRPPEPQLRGARPRDGAVRAARAARVPGGRARRRLRRVRVLLRSVRDGRLARRAHHERIVAVHARLRTPGRPRARRSSRSPRRRSGSACSRC